MFSCCRLTPSKILFFGERNGGKSAAARDSNEIEFRAVPAICLGRVGRRNLTLGLSQNGAGASRLTPLPSSKRMPGPKLPVYKQTRLSLRMHPILIALYLLVERRRCDLKDVLKIG
jgi:hypothetical protein